MEKLIILLDLDDVLNNQNELWIESLNSTYKLNVKYEDIKDWNISQFYPSLSNDELYSPVSNPGLVPRMSPQKDSIQFTKEWHNRGHTIMVTTSTSTENIDTKSHWLKKHYGWFTCGNLILTHKKQLIRGDILIDDGVHNLLPDKEIGIESIYMKLCFDRPWNRGFDCEAHGIQRVADFAEIDKVVRTLENE